MDVAYMRDWLESEGSPKCRIDLLEAPPAEPIGVISALKFEIDTSYGHAPRAAQAGGGRVVLSPGPRAGVRMATGMKRR